MFTFDNKTVNLKQIIDDVLLEFTNRGQSVTHKTLKVAIGRITNKSLSEIFFRAVLSLNME